MTGQPAHLDGIRQSARRPRVSPGRRAKGGQQSCLGQVGRGARPSVGSARPCGACLVGLRELGCGVERLLHRRPPPAGRGPAVACRLLSEHKLHLVVAAGGPGNRGGGFNASCQRRVLQTERSADWWQPAELCNARGAAPTAADYTSRAISSAAHLHRFFPSLYALPWATKAGPGQTVSAWRV